MAFRIASHSGTCRFSDDSFELVSTEGSVLVRVPTSRLCGASACKSGESFDLWYNDKSVNRSVEVHCPDAAASTEWVSEIRQVLGDRRGVAVPRLMVFVNPHAGPGKAKSIAETAILPVLKASGAAVDVKETEYIGHAEEMCKTLAVDDYDMLVIVSGRSLPLSQGLLGPQPQPMTLTVACSYFPLFNRVSLCPISLRAVIPFRRCTPPSVDLAVWVANSSCPSAHPNTTRPLIPARLKTSNRNNPI